jgi:GPH family glycoside/pentoside/hexuronide:cation symporter
MNPSSPVPPDVEADKLNFTTKLAYGAGDLGPAVTANIQVIFQLIFFTNVAGIPASLAGSILLIGKVWDAINDPIVGVLSDRTQSRWGRRYPWMLFGAIPFGITFFLMWIVPRFSENPSLNQTGLFWYYVITAILFNTFYTMVNLPYTALTPEMTQDYDERTSLNSFRFSFSIGGSIASLLLAFGIFSLIKNNPLQQYLVLGLVCTVIAVLPIYWCVWGTWQRTMGVSRRRSPSAQSASQDPSESLPYLQQLRIVFSNRPFLFVIGIYLFSWLALQNTVSIIPFYIVNWMRQSNSTFTLVILAVQVTALTMLFVWSKASQRFGKRAVYFMGMSLWIIAEFGLFFLQPGQTGMMYFLAVLAGFGVSTAYLIPWSMLPDVIELDELETGQRREGVFYAFMVLLQKIGLALGLFLVGQVLDAAGFIEATGNTVPVQPESALFAIRVLIGPIPATVLVGGLVLAYFYPITREKHAETLLKLEERRRLGIGDRGSGIEEEF